MKKSQRILITYPFVVLYSIILVSGYVGGKISYYIKKND